MQESVTDPDTDKSEILTERLALGLTVCALGLSLWGLIQREPYQAVLLALALVPIAAMVLAGVRPHAVRILAGTQDARSNVTIAFALPGIVLSLYALTIITPVDRVAAFGVGVLVALLIGLIAAALDRPFPRRAEPVVLLVLLSLPYGYGASQTLNLVLDGEAPQVLPAKVLDKQSVWIGTDLRHVRLGPWGPRTEAGLIGAGADLFAAVEPGDVVCVTAHPGALGLSYMDVSATCPSSVDKSLAAGPIRVGKTGIGLDARDRGDYATAVWALKDAAYRGGADAQFFLGLMYLDAQGLKTDHKEARRLWRLAAAQGHGRAMNAIGYVHDHGIGVDYDPQEAAAWYRKAVAKNEPRAMSNLGILYRTGRGVTRDLVEMRRLWRDAAKRNHAPAMNNLGEVYATGTGVAPDMDKAAEWWRRSVALGNRDASWYLGHHLTRPGATPAELAEGVKVLEQGAKAGNAQAALTLSYLYREGRGVPKGWSEQIRWLDHAVRLKYPPAIAHRGSLYLEQQDLKNGIAMYRSAANMGYARAQAYLGQQYQIGNGVPRDMREAVRLYRQAAIQGDALGQRLLAYLFDTGLGVQRNPAEAARLYRLAAKQGDGYAAGNLGLMYLTGRGIPRNMAEGYKWTKMAAEHNQPVSMNSLAHMLDKGIHVGRDVTAALDLYRRAAAFGQPNAAHSLSAHYFTGRSIERDIGNAYYWVLVAERGYDASERKNVARLKQAILQVLTRSGIDRAGIEQRVMRFRPLPVPVAPVPEPKPIRLGSGR